VGCGDASRAIRWAPWNAHVARRLPHPSFRKGRQIAERQEAPLSEINWAVELRKIEREYDGLPPEPTAAEQRQRREAERRERERQEARAASFGAYFRLTLVLCLAISIAAWPYPIDCGLSVWGYLTAIIILVAGGVWTAAATWQCRGAWRHAIALLVVLWALSLGASQVLPRVGYAMPAPGRPTTWSCAAG
jgi:hypothetical protein